MTYVAVDEAETRQDVLAGDVREERGRLRHRRSRVPLLELLVVDRVELRGTAGIKHNTTSTCATSVLVTNEKLGKKKKIKVKMTFVRLLCYLIDNIQVKHIVMTICL